MSENLVKKQHKDIKKFLTESKENNIIDNFLAKNLLPEEPRSGALYLTPKVHKPEKFYDTPSGNNIPQCRPIISGCGSNTERISWFVDSHVKDSVKNLESYVEDTPDMLRFLESAESKGDLPPNAIPVALDIKSMYTNIPTDEGIDAVREELDRREDQTIPTIFFITLLQFILKCNVF